MTTALQDYDYGVRRTTSHSGCDCTRCPALNPLSLDEINTLLAFESPLEDPLTKLIDQLSQREFEMARKAMGYFENLSPEYKESRRKWFEDAAYLKKVKRVSELGPDVLIREADRQRIHFSLTHPLGTWIEISSPEQAIAVYNLLWKTIRVLGPERSKKLGYCFSNI